jgi:hypothetical protein
VLLLNLMIWQYRIPVRSRAAVSRRVDAASIPGSTSIFCQSTLFFNLFKLRVLFGNGDTFIVEGGHPGLKVSFFAP